MVGIGASKKITESGFYNLSVALPFICAFYIMNTSNIYTLPILEYSIGKGLSVLLDILKIAFIYYITMGYVVIMTISSQIVKSNSFYFIIPLIFFLGAIYTVLYEGGARFSFSIIILLHTTAFFIFHWLNRNKEADISLVVSYFIGGVLSLVLFVSGVLWYFNDYEFINVVKMILNLSEINSKSYLLGSVMLITLGYSIFYGLFVLDYTTED